MRGGLKPYKRAQPAILIKQVIKMLQISESKIDYLYTEEDYNVDYDKPIIGYIPELQQEVEA